MKSCRSGLGVHCGRSIKLAPFHGVAKALHQAMSLRAASERLMWWLGEEVMVEVSISLRRNVLPAGTTLAEKLSVPMRERSAPLTCCPVVKGSVQVCQLVLRQPGFQLGGVEEDAQEFQDSAWAFELLLCEWDTQLLADCGQGVEGCAALRGVCGAHDQEVV